MNDDKFRRIEQRSRTAVTLWCLLSSASVLLSLASAGPTTAARGKPRRPQPAELVRPYDKNGAFYGGDLWSPDNQYIASARRIEAAGLNLTILDARTRKPLAYLKGANGFVWVPRHRHRLVAAASGIAGRPFLGIWEGGDSFRSLVRVRAPNVTLLNPGEIWVRGGGGAQNDRTCTGSARSGAVGGLCHAL